jgi:hypothetical protein
VEQLVSRGLLRLGECISQCLVSKVFRQEPADPIESLARTALMNVEAPKPRKNSELNLVCEGVLDAFVTFHWVVANVQSHRPCDPVCKWTP